MKSRIRADRRRRGFTLLEVLLVMGILVVLAAIALPNLIGVQEDSKLRATKLQVRAFDEAMGIYNVTYGRFPNTNEGLAALTTPPTPAPQTWKPLISDANVLDPWNQPYQYAYPGSKNTTGGPDIWSNGPDGQANSADDIGNWPTPK